MVLLECSLCSQTCFACMRELSALEICCSIPLLSPFLEWTWQRCLSPWERWCFCLLKLQTNHTESSSCEIFIYMYTYIYVLSVTYANSLSQRRELHDIIHLDCNLNNFPGHAHFLDCQLHQTCVRFSSLGCSHSVLCSDLGPLCLWGHVSGGRALWFCELEKGRCDIVSWLLDACYDFCHEHKRN